MEGLADKLKLLWTVLCCLLRTLFIGIPRVHKTFLAIYAIAKRETGALEKRDVKIHTSITSKFSRPISLEKREILNLFLPIHTT